MSKDGKADLKKQVAGSLKEAIGKIAGDQQVQAEGITEKKTGKAQTMTPGETGKKAS